MQTGRLGKYRIIAKLGQGGMATVYLSVVPGPAGFNKLLVVKELKEDLSHDPDFLNMFLNEARLAARLNHPNVVQTYEVGVEEGRHFLVMDYLDGQPLHAVLRRASRTKMPLDIHVRVLADMLAGMHYAHTLRDFDGTPLNVVHRDISPQNVFVTYDGQVKLVDFGIAKAAGASTTTQSGVFKGKLSYVAPEQAAGEPLDARADLFSVGVMLWEAMAARRFAQGDAQAALLARRLSGTEPRIREVVPDADAELADICDRAMALSPDDRFRSAGEFRDALENFLDRFSRRVGPREVGELMTSLFGAEREKIRYVIDEQMKQLLRETAQLLPVPNLDVHEKSGDPTPITTQEGLARARRAMAEHGHLEAPMPRESGPGSVTGAHGTLVTSQVTQHPPVKSSSRAILISLFALAVASVLGMVFVIFMDKPAPKAEPAASPPTASAAPAAERVTLSITYGPAGVTAKLDGNTLSGSPFTAQVPRDGSLHKIEFEGPGLSPVTRMVSYDKDVTLDVMLAPPAVDTALATASASAAPTAAPATRPGKLPKSSIGIDEEDPYKK